jgi:hypothetical protein
VVALLRDSLNQYGYQALSDAEKRRWQEAYDAGQEDAYSALFGPDKIAAQIGSFLGWFMVRKVMAGEDFLRAAGTVTKKLARWLEEDSLAITRVEPGRLWLGEVGPLELPKRATDAARVGWEVWVVAARVGGRWHLLENGFVYP